MIPSVSISCQPIGLDLAPQAGFEPATLRLTAGCSAVELLRNTVGRDVLGRKDYSTGRLLNWSTRRRRTAGCQAWASHPAPRHRLATARTTARSSAQSGGPAGRRSRRPVYATFASRVICIVPRYAFDTGHRPSASFAASTNCAASSPFRPYTVTVSGNGYGVVTNVVTMNVGATTIVAETVTPQAYITGTLNGQIGTGDERRCGDEQERDGRVEEVLEADEPLQEERPR